MGGKKAGRRGAVFEPGGQAEHGVAWGPWRSRSGGEVEVGLGMQAGRGDGWPPGVEADYAICLWGLPADADPDAPVETLAREAIVARNLEGECHLVLRFDLVPGARLEVGLRQRPQP